MLAKKNKSVIGININSNLITMVMRQGNQLRGNFFQPAEKVENAEDVDLTAIREYITANKLKKQLANVALPAMWVLKKVLYFNPELTENDIALEIK